MNNFDLYDTSIYDSLIIEILKEIKNFNYDKTFFDSFKNYEFSSPEALEFLFIPDKIINIMTTKISNLTKNLSESDKLIFFSELKSNKNYKLLLLEFEKINDKIFSERLSEQ